ncbi:MAG: mraZ [Opitutales bacterium]|nr:mraZ [Opitutales bacterium]
MNLLQTSQHYVDSFHHKLDGRFRVAIPAQWRVSGDEENYYWAWPHPEGCIAVFPPEMQQEFLEKARAIKQSDIRGQRMLRQFFGNASKFGCDKQGRILLPENLRSHSAILKDVVFVGLGRNFQIWSEERWTPPESEDFDLLETMAELDF